MSDKPKMRRVSVVICDRCLEGRHEAVLLRRAAWRRFCATEECALYHAVIPHSEVSCVAEPIGPGLIDGPAVPRKNP